MKSLDPRVSLLKDIPDQTKIKDNEYWETFEVFHQKKRGGHHTHVGSLHAPSPELAMVFAKEQFGRRLQCASLWVVKTTEVWVSGHKDADMFNNATSEEKKYRDASGFKVRNKINEYRKKHDMDAKPEGESEYFGVDYGE